MLKHSDLMKLIHLISVILSGLGIVPWGMSGSEK